MLKQQHGLSDYAKKSTSLGSIASATSGWISTRARPISSWKSGAGATATSPTFATRCLSRAAFASTAVTFSHSLHLRLVMILRPLLGRCSLSSCRKSLSFCSSSILHGLSTLDTSSGFWGHRAFLGHRCLLELAPRLVQDRL